MFFKLFFLCIFGAAFAGENLDSSFAKIISSIVDHIDQKNLTDVSLNSMTVPFKYHKLPGRLYCTEGSVRSVGSLKKSDEVQVIKEGSTTIITVPLRLSTLQYTYDKCRYTLMSLLSWTEGLTVEAVSNTIQIQATVSKGKDGKCNALLANIKFNKLAKVNLTSGVLAKQLEPTLNQVLLNHLQKDVSRAIIDKLEIVVPLFVTDDYLCSVV